MHNRQPITPKLLWKSLKDYDLWPLYIIGLLFEIPTTPQSQYLTLSLKGHGFSTIVTNLLSIPYNVLGMITMMTITYASEVFGELSFTAMTVRRLSSHPNLATKLKFNRAKSGHCHS